MFSLKNSSELDPLVSPDAQKAAVGCALDRAASRIRNRAPLGAYSRTMPLALTVFMCLAVQQENCGGLLDRVAKSRTQIDLGEERRNCILGERADINK